MQIKIKLFVVVYFAVRRNLNNRIKRNVKTNSRK